jgi:glycosyltransferase involved in cell wall biosynthesis
MSGLGAAVTVVIPVWDGYVRYLGEAVESVRRNAASLPIVVVDNASATEVPALAGCEFVRSETRLSVGGARNLGLAQVRTEFVVFLDADDRLLDGALAFLHRTIDADPGLAVSATSILDAATGHRHRFPRRFAARLAAWPRAFALANSVWSLIPLQGCAVLRTAQVREAGGYADSDLGEDWVLAVSLCWRGSARISQRLGRYYRATQGSLAGRAWTNRELRENARRVRQRLREDPAVPGWARAMLPAIASLQLLAIYLARPAFQWIRRLPMVRPNIR